MRRRTGTVGHAHCIFLPSAIMELVGATSETEWELDVATRGGEKILTLYPYPLSSAAVKRGEKRKEEIRTKRIESIKNVREKKKRIKAEALTAQGQQTLRELEGETVARRGEDK